ncbi:ABC transporter ATP-binding protein/permease [uncultured Mameliella sp.]|uniref:ABC transporter ATP-binding protein/permease n=1 Tax=uncultured Mameliella sp. TaxID=1447087 RepID=UPI002610D743|nr:ATP-binding cassette domain-containing protein [uncultured Mameliella sp.]
MRQDSRTRAERSSRIGAALSLGAALVWPVQAVLIARVLADLLTGSTGLSPFWAALGFLALAGLRGLLDMTAQRMLSAAASAQIHALRTEILTVETAAAAPSHSGGAGAIAALLTEKLEALRPYALRYRPAHLRSTVLPLLILGIAAWHSWAVALVLLMAGPLIPVFMALVGWAAKEASARQMGEIGALSDLLADRLAALSDLRLIGAGGAVVNGFAGASEELRNRTMAVLRIAFLSSTVLELFSALGVAMIAVWVGFSLLGELSWGTWGAPLTPFAGIYLLLLAPEFFQPLRDLAAAWHDKAGADAVKDELDHWREETRPQRLGRGVYDDGPRFDGLRWQGLTLTREGRALSWPDTAIAPGDSVAITGASGVGKTTLLRLLAGLEAPDSGTIHLGQTPLTDDTADAWRARIGWMPQAPHFLNRSLRHNIAFGAPLDPKTLDRARLGAVLAALPKGTLTPLGERGAGLSGGEARRVMLARALHGAPVVLLADEPTADLDAQTAGDVIEGLMGFVARGGTLIVATHDPRLSSRMARNLVLENGA